MTMHIVGPWLTNTNTKKRQQKVTKSQQEEIERGWRERNARLKQMGLPKETLEEYTDWLYGRGKKEKKKKNDRAVYKTTAAKAGTIQTQAATVVQKADEELEGNTPIPKSLGLWITGPVSSKPSPVYTGTKVKGIGTMHKSNAVPVFSDEEAVDISRMRR